MKNKFTIYDCSFDGTATDFIKELEREVHYRDGLLIKTFVDLNYKIPNPRPEFNALLEFLDSKPVDGLIVYSLDQIALSFNDLERMLEVLLRRDINLICLHEGIDTSKTAQNFIWDTFKSLFKVRDLEHRARTIKGVKTARKKGVKLGRPGVDDASIRTTIKFLMRGYKDETDALLPWQIQKKAGISSATFYGIRTIFRTMNQGLNPEKLREQSNLGTSTFNRVIKVFYELTENELPEL